MKPTEPVNHVSVGRYRRYIGRPDNFCTFSPPLVHRRAASFFLFHLLASKNQHVGRHFVKSGEDSVFVSDLNTDDPDRGPGTSLHLYILMSPKSQR